MSDYAELVEEEVKQADYLAVIKPRKRLSTFTLVSGSVYSTPFTLSQYVSQMYYNGAAMSMGSSPSLSAGQFYLDSEAQLLYLRLSDSSNPNSALKFIIATYEIYVGTFDATFHRDPEDDSTTEVYFEPIITGAPDIKGQVSDLLFGFLPVQTTSISLSNTDHFLEEVIYDSSLNQAEIAVYHWLSFKGELAVSNIKKVLKGLCGKISYDTDRVTFEVLDRVDLMSREWRNYDENFYSTVLFPNLDPKFIGRPIRYIFGKVKGVVPVNVSYVSDEPTTSDNREHAVMSEVNDIAEKVFTVAASPSSTTTRTYLTASPKGISIGDTVFLDGSTDYFVEVTGINYGVNPYIEHAAIGAPMNPTEQVKKGFVSRVDILQNGQRFTAFYGRDYTCTDNLLSANVAGIVFDSSLESNLSMPNTLTPTDTIYCTVYGRGNNVTLGGNPFGTDDSELGVLTDPVVILWKLLKDKIGLSESDLNADSFEDLYSLIGGQSVGISIPESVTSNFPAMKKIFIDLCQTILTSLFVDTDLKWKATRQGPISTIDHEISSDEIVDNTFKASFEYDDIISDVTVEYNKQEKGESLSSEGISDKVTASSDIAAYLHGVQKQKSFSSLHIKESEAQDLCDNLSLIFGDRSSKYNLSTVSKFYAALISEKASILRQWLPGFSFSEGVENQRDLVITSVQKSLDRVTLELTDQKGIEENSSSWVE